MLFILNSDLQIIDTLSLKGIVSQGNTPYFDDYYTQTLATGSETFEFKTIADSKESKNIVVGNYIAFRDDNGEDKLFNIIETIESKSEDGFVKYVYCEMHGIELRNSIIRPTNILNASVNKFAETILNGTDWSLGKVDDFGTLLDINIEEHTSVYDAIQKYIVGEYGAEIYYTIKIESNSVVSKYLNIVETRGFDDGLKFTYNKNIQNIERTIDTSDLCTALIGIGNNGLTFKNIETEYKPLNQDFVENANAYKQWSVNGYHIFGYEVFDTDSEQELLKLTRAKLEKRGTPKAKYELSVELLDDKVSIGDFVRITDMEFEPPITLGARISVLTKSKTDIDGNTCEISNFQHLQSNITDQMRRLSTTLKGYADNVNIDNVNRGGFLTSKIEVVNDNTLKINNSVEKGKDFCFEFKGLTPQPILTNFSFPKGKVMQQAIVDYHENKIYMSYDEHSYGDITLFQLDMSGNILGKMVLNQFGHGNSYGIERRNNKTYIWMECDAKTIYASEPEKLRGTKICYFEFEDGVTATKTHGTVIDILPNWNAMQLAIDDEYNQLAVRALDKTGGTYYYHIYDLKSVINKSPELKYKFKDVGLQGQSAYQGFDILGNYIYAIQGAGYYSHPPKMDTYVTCIDIKTGKKRYVNLIDILPDAPYREMEGIKVIKRSERVYELNFGLVTEHESPRKNHIFKYTQTLPLENNPQGKFIHPNGVTTLIQEGLIKIDSSKKKNYLMYVVDGERFGFEDEYSKQIIVANYENGTWYCNGEVFKPMANDCLIGSATNNENSSFDLTIYSDSPNLIGNTLSGSSDGFIYENGQILVNANSLVGQLPSDLIEVESITANHISANAITTDKIQANSINADHIKTEVFDAIDANVQNLVADKANVSDLNATNATIESLKAKDVQIENLVANKANIEDLNATNVTIENLQATKADITDLNVTNANIQNLQANKADIVELNATKGEITQLKSQVAEIGVLKGDVADIENILAGNITADNIASGAITSDKIQTGAITAGSSIIADGAIGSAQISSLDANKITAGEIDTSKVKIKGENGFLFIENNTLYVVDNNRKIRCELGVIENNSNYGFVVRGADGQTIMLDHRGVHNAGITDGAIDNRKVSENANISGKKLDIDSVVRSINEDGSVTLQGTKVQIGNTTLDVKLSEQNNLITEQGQRLATQQSEITANTNAIKLKVDNQTYTADKNEMNTKLNKATSDISVMQGQIALKVEQTDIENAVDELEGTVDQKIRDAKAEIKVTTDSISQRVASTESTLTTTTNKIDNLQIGGRNFVTNSTKFWQGKGANGITSTVGSDGVLAITASSGNGNWYTGWSNGDAVHVENNFNEGDKVTISFTMKSPTGTIIPSVYFKEGMGYFPMKGNISTNYSTVYCTTTWKKANSLSFHLGFGDAIGTYYIKDWKIEKGSEPTSWTPAPEDVDSSIASVDSKVATTNNKVAELTTNLNGITQRVSANETTTSTLTTTVESVRTTANNANNLANTASTNATTALNTANSAKDTASSASTKADNAVSTATTANNTANTNKNNIATLQSTVTTTNNRVAELTTNLDGITQRVASTENTLTATNVKLDGLQVGGRNYIPTSGNFTNSVGNWIQNGSTISIDSSVTYLEYNTIKIGSNSPNGIVYNGWIKLKPNTTYTYSITAKADKVVQGDSSEPLHMWLNTYMDTAHLETIEDASHTSISTSWGRSYVVFKTPNNAEFYYWKPFIYGKGNATVWVANFQCEEGNKPSDWTPPIEEVQTQIDSIGSKVQATNNKVASIETNLNGITQRVSSTESTVSTHTTQLGTVDTRINNAKNSAISTASGDATTKANNALADAKTYTNGQITTVNTTINNKVAEIKATTDAITQRVSSTESTVTSHTTQLGTVDNRINTAKQDAISSAVGVKDTRNTNENPQWYFTNYPRRTVEEFKYANRVGISGSNVYGVLTTVVPWTESSGGYPTQTFRSNGTATFTRKGTSNTAWSAWTQVEDTAGSQAKATQALNDAKAYTTTEVTKTNNKVATIETNLSGITSRVSATETNLTTATNKLNNLQVGSTNLLVGSSDVSRFTDYWANNGCSILNSYYKGSRIYKVSGAWNDYGFKLPSISSELATGKKYTFSVYVKSSSSSYLPEVNVYGGGWSSHLGRATTSWQRFTFKGAFSELTSQLRIEPTSNSSDGANHYLMVAGMQLEEGEVLTDYSPSPKDSEITVSNLTTRVSTAESKLTKNSLTTTIGSHYTTSNDVNGIVTSKGYATTSQVQQTKNDLTATFKESGGYNLLRNGCANLDTSYWYNNGGGISRVLNAGGGYVGNFFSTSMPSGITGEWVRLKNNVDYVYQAKIYLPNGTFTGDGTRPLHFWCNTSQTNGTSQLTVLDYSATIPQNGWTQCYVHFKTKASGNVWFKPFIYTGSGTQTIYVTELMLSESKVVLPYSPHPSEIYEGITKIDKDGIQVSQSNISTTTKMNANGFYINKGGTDVFKVDSNGLVMNGNVTATSGRVANFTISGNDLIGSNVGMGGASGTNYAFWAGSNASSSAPFRVGHDGSFRATNATITGTISGSTISGSSFSSYGTNSDSGQSQSMSLDSGLLSLEGSFAGGTNAGQRANKTYVYSNGIVVKDISDSGNAGNGDAFYSNTGISFRAKSSGGEQYGSLSKIMTFGSDRISTTKNMYAEKFYGAGLFCTYTNLYLGCDGEVRATDMNGRNDGNTVYKPIRASKFMRADGKHAYINNTGGGTLTSADSALVANGMRTDATDFFLGVGGQVRVTDKNGYNNGNGLTYKPITASAHNNSSDLIFKKNIKKLDDSKNIKMFSENKESFAIKTLKDVTVYEYDLVDGEENQIGLIAQECPQVLRGSDAMYDLDIETANSITDEERKELINEDVVGASINLYSMATMLWKVCQEQQTMIEKLEKRISELENKVTE